MDWSALSDVDFSVLSQVKKRCVLSSVVIADQVNWKPKTKNMLTLMYNVEIAINDEKLVYNDPF